MGQRTDRQLGMPEVKRKVRRTLECHKGMGKPGPGWSGEERLVEAPIWVL